MATRQAAVLARRGATRILSSSSARAGSALASSSAESYFQVARRDGILGAERGLATVVVMRRTAGLTELLIRPLSGPLPNPVLPKLANGMRGRFEVSEDYDFESFVLNGSPKESRRTEDREQSRREKESRELRKADDRVDRDSFRRVGSFGSERVLSSIRGLTMGTRELDRSSLQYPSAAISKKFPCIQISQFHATSSVDAVQEIGMPSLSPTMTQGNIAKWRKKEGEKVSAGDILCEIETDKATVDMESMEDGFLGKVLVGDGAKDIPCGQAICLMVESEDELKTIADYKPTGGGSAPALKAPSPSPAAAAPPPSPPKESPKPASSKPSAPPPTRPTGDRVFASPAARKLAEDKNVSLSSIKGTGPEGSILKADVEEYLATGPSPSRSSTKQGVSAGRALAGDVDYRDIPNTQIRKITAKRLLQSKQTIPHYYLSLDTRVDKLLRLRADLNKNLEASQIKGGPVRKVSLNDFVIKAAALALKKVPEVNSYWTEEYIRQYNNVNIGIAVQTEHGLMVPVVKDADKKGLATISDDIKALAGKARSNTLKPNDYEGGTFTVSNLGSFGVKQFCAIVNPPQACILAVGTTEKRVFPGAESGEYEPGNVMTVTLSCDHRVIDGAVGAQWLGAFKGYIEDPVTLML